MADPCFSEASHLHLLREGPPIKRKFTRSIGPFPIGAPDLTSSHLSCRVNMTAILHESSQHITLLPICFCGFHHHLWSSEAIFLPFESTLDGPVENAGGFSL